jgi:DNA-binding LacI/PurR family transcriptional regulator
MFPLIENLRVCRDGRQAVRARSFSKMTIDEIAKLAKTSSATVSLALNNRPGVSPSTRQKILAIASETGYLSKHKQEKQTPRKMIKLVAVSKPDTSGIHNFRTSFFAEIINCVQSRCALWGYSLTYSIVSHENIVSALKDGEVGQTAAGLILIGTYLNDDEVAALSGLEKKMVLLDRNCSLTDMDTVGINNYMGAYRGAVYLIEAGHRNIGSIQSASRVANLEERRQGFLDALKDHQLSLLPEASFLSNSYLQNSAEVLQGKLQKLKTMPTAFFCENDYNALCLISALNKANYRVPEDVSVVGFDDVPESVIVTPQLTTIRVNREALAYAAVDRLHAIISSEKEQSSQHILINVDLVCRESARILDGGSAATAEET